jgi:hypothetical protein
MAYNRSINPARTVATDSNQAHRSERRLQVSRAPRLRPNQKVAQTLGLR